MASDHHLFLTMPGYGQLTAGASRGFWRATRLPDTQVHYEYREGSLLAANFNTLWCSALNAVRRGEQVDYFAMQHADIEPEDFWLDTLIEELEAQDLDVLGVAVPIKDGRGTTSLALARDDGDNWRPLCRLTMTEIHRLPATFTSADLGHSLLLNTGLWVCRFDPAWVNKLHFEINDRIIFDEPSDCYRPQTEPEDWFFTRLLHEIGKPGSPTEEISPLRIGATRKVTLTHRGGTAWSNERPYGEPFDSAWVDASTVPDDLPGFQFPWDVEGWLLYHEGRELARLARGAHVLEIGSYQGCSTICLAQTADYVRSVDPHDGRATPFPQETRAKLSANLDRYGLRRKVEILQGTFAQFAPIYSDLRFDLIFIDGDHARAAVEADIEASLPLLAPGGLLAFHDYTDATNPGVAEAVNAFLASGAELLSLTNSLAVVRPPALIPSTMEV